MEMDGLLKTRQKNTGNKLIPIGLFILILIIWQYIVAKGKVERYILPAPSDIIKVFKTESYSFD